MNREQVKELLPIIQAYAEGKQIEIKTKEGKSWSTLEEDDIQYLDFKKCDFRIKPEPKYRPFKDAEECWTEMLKHQPFGWIKPINEYVDKYKAINIARIETDNEYPIKFINDYDSYSFKYLCEEYTFIDGTPFGIKDE